MHAPWASHALSAQLPAHKLPTGLRLGVHVPLPSQLPWSDRQPPPSAVQAAPAGLGELLHTPALSQVPVASVQFPSGVTQEAPTFCCLHTPFAQVGAPHGPLMSPQAVPSGAGVIVQLKSPATEATMQLLAGTQGVLPLPQASSTTGVAQEIHRITRCECRMPAPLCKGQGRPPRLRVCRRKIKAF